MSIYGEYIIVEYIIVEYIIRDFNHELYRSSQFSFLICSHICISIK